METAATAAIVVTWNRLDLVRANGPSWAGQSRPFGRLLLVANGGNRVGRGEAAVPGFDVLRLRRNRGFAGAANRGIRAALGDPAVRYLALVNDDVRLAPDWHERALAVLANHDDVGGVATCLLRADRPDVIDTAGIAWSDDAWAENHRSGASAASLGSEPSPVFGASAAAALFRRELFEEIGLFDASFFAYQEDVDLALRARAAGWRFLLAPAARGWHDGHASNRRFPLGGTWADFLNARNRLALLAKSVPAAQWKQSWRSILRAHARAAAASFGERRAGAVLAGTLHGLLRLPAGWLRRGRETVRRAAP